MAATIAVVYPHANALGGDGFWLIAAAGRRTPIAIDAAGRAAPDDRPLRRPWAWTRSPFAAPQAANTVAGAVGAWAWPTRRRGVRRQPGVGTAAGGRHLLRAQRHAGHRGPAPRNRRPSGRAGRPAGLCGDVSGPDGARAAAGQPYEAAGAGRNPGRDRVGRSGQVSTTARWPRIAARTWTKSAAR